METMTHPKHAVNMTEAERVASAIGGGILAVVGLTKKSPGGIAMALLGGDLLRRAITGHCYLYGALGIRTAPKGQGAATTSVPYELGIRVDRSITIARPRAEVYAFWRDLSNLSKFMTHIESVKQTEGNQSHWVVKGPAGRTVEWDAVIHNEIENEMVAWRTLPGADVDHAGSVWFKDAPAGRGVEVSVELQYNPPAGLVGAAFAKLWGEEPTQQIESDLYRLKQLLEAGEIVITEGQPAGGESKHTHQARSHNEWEVQSASEASFPASDAPSYTH
jgi:uncharacterized membrane protein